MFLTILRSLHRLPHTPQRSTSGRQGGTLCELPHEVKNLYQSRFTKSKAKLQRTGKSRFGSNKGWSLGFGIIHPYRRGTTINFYTDRPLPHNHDDFSTDDLSLIVTRILRLNGMKIANPMHPF